MAEHMRREVSTWIQYATITLLAAVLTFVYGLPGGKQEGQYAEAINLQEAWRNYAPVVRSWLLIFLLLSTLRLVIVYVLHKKLKGK